MGTGVTQGEGRRVQGQLFFLGKGTHTEKRHDLREEVPQEKRGGRFVLSRGGSDGRNTSEGGGAPGGELNYLVGEKGTLRGNKGNFLTTGLEIRVSRSGRKGKKK